LEVVFAVDFSWNSQYVFLHLFVFTFGGLIFEERENSITPLSSFLLLMIDNEIMVEV